MFIKTISDSAGRVLVHANARKNTITFADAGCVRNFYDFSAFTQDTGLKLNQMEERFKLFQIGFSAGDVGKKYQVMTVFEYVVADIDWVRKVQKGAALTKEDLRSYTFEQSL